MEEVNLYIETSIHGLKAKKGYYSYLLEYIRPTGEPSTRQAFEKLEDATEARLILTAMAEAVRRIKKPCILRIFTQREAILMPIEKKWVKDWKENGWKNAKGQPVKNAELWKKLTEQLSTHLYTFHFTNHEYRAWLQVELQKIEKQERN